MATELEKLDAALKNVNQAVQTVVAVKESQERKDYNNQVLNLSKDQQAWSQDFNERQFTESLNQWDKSYNFNIGAANLAQYNFENATKIRANDMQQVGLNPLNLVGGAEGSTANFMSGTSPSGSASSSAASPVSPISVADLFGRFAAMRHESIENRKNRASAEKVASIQAQTAKDVAQINAESSKYGSDLGYTAESEANDIARLKFIADKEARNAELLEKQHQFDVNLEKDVKMFNEKISLESNRIYHEDSRVLASLNSENFRTALNAYNSAIHNSMEFALSINKLRLERDKFEYSQDYDQKKLALENTKIALENAARQMESITGLAGDVCKSFIIGSLSSGRR